MHDSGIKKRKQDWMLVRSRAPDAIRGMHATKTSLTGSYQIHVRLVTDLPSPACVTALLECVTALADLTFVRPSARLQGLPAPFGHWTPLINCVVLGQHVLTDISSQEAQRHTLRLVSSTSIR